VSSGEGKTGRSEESAVVAAARAGDESAFGGLAERYRRELRVHCYRMLGSFEDSEDLVQETFLRAWRRRETFEGRSTFRAWLYRIATNACLDFLGRQPRARQTAASPGGGSPPPAAIPWLQPYPDGLLETISPGEDEPDTALVERETIELAFLAAIQCLPPRQRAVLILRDVLGWPAKDTAALLESSVFGLPGGLGINMIVGSAPPEKAGSASSMSETSQELGLSLGFATLGSLGAAIYRGGISETIPSDVPPRAAETARESLAGAVSAADGLPATLGADLLEAAREAFTAGLTTTAGIGAGIAPSSSSRSP